MNTRVIFAVFKRNFLGYFANPTGYVFICVFVLLSAVAAFLPDEFFNANLANLDQLNIWFPLIMLVFVPAITMGSWADERRQGTDELLLTLPASDFDIVIGKYKAAVSIYTVALLFSLCCNFIVLSYLGNPDHGLLFCTYFGYWLIGLAMLSIGMVASFLTGNLTVAYILGAIFCAPLVALQWADIAPSMFDLAASLLEMCGFEVGRSPSSGGADTISLLKQFSIGDRFAPFGRGMVMLSGIIYFGMIVATMLYLCIVLIGRRHWAATQVAVGRFHFTIRTISLFVIGLCCCLLIQRHDLRYDMTAEKLSTLSPETVKLLRDLKPEHPVIIEAFLSPEVPEPYVQTKMNIQAVLGEIGSICSRNVTVRMHAIQPHTQEALNAAQRYNIRPQNVRFASRGTLDQRSIYLGVSLRSGLKTLTLPFIDRGLSPEYEIVHALGSIVDPTKKRIGILITDAPLMGGPDYANYMSLSMRPSWRIVDELRKQYTVVEVDPREPIVEKYDALLAVQPSTLGPTEMQNFVDALRAGQPTVIFEDPLPIPGFSGDLPGTADPRRAPSQMMMMMGQNQPKGDITLLWELLGVAFDGNQAVWQDYNPIRKLTNLPKGFIFVDRTRSGEPNAPQPFGPEDPISADIQYMMFVFPGSIAQSTSPDSKRTYKSLVQTFREPAGRLLISNLRRMRNDMEIDRYYEQLNRQFDLAVHLQGELPSLPSPPLEESQTPPKPEPIPLNVVLIADVDMISDGMFELRNRGSEPGAGINLNFDNVTFVLNAIDAVTGDMRYLAVRGRRPTHRTLREFDRQTAAIRDITSQKRQDLQQEFEEAIAKDQAELEKSEEEIRKQYESGNLGQNETTVRILTKVAGIQKTIMETKEQKEQELAIALEEADVELNKRIHAIQGRYKFLAVVIPPIPPLLVGLIVLLVRRSRETEGVPKARRRKIKSSP